MYKFLNKTTIMSLSLNHHVCVSFPNYWSDIRGMSWREEALWHASIRFKWRCCNNNVKDNNAIITITIKNNCLCWNWSWRKIKKSFFLRTCILYDAKASIFFCQVSDNASSIICLWSTSCWSTRWIELFNMENLNDFHS